MKKGVCFQTILCYEKWFQEVVTHNGCLKIGF